MSEQVFQSRGETAAAASARKVSARATTVAVDPPETTTGLDEIHTALNDTPRANHAMQLRRSLNQSPRVAELARLGRMVQQAPAGGPTVQRIELTDAMWKHISLGELRDGSKLVGYHWTGDDEAIAEKSGESKQGPDDRGVYVEGVQTKQQYGQGKKKGPIKKAKASTFWPDAWTEAEIKNAIANGGAARNNRSEVSNKATKVEARGMFLFVNPDSVFPEFEEKEESKERGGNKKGGGRRR